MTHQMRLLILVVFSFMLGTSVSAQGLKNFNKFSIEVSGGMHIPVTPTDLLDDGDYSGFQQFQASARYMISPMFGLKAYFGFNKFDAGEEGSGRYYELTDLNNTFTRVGIEGVVNLGDLFNMSPRFVEKNGILFHAGAGLTFSSPSTIQGKVDRMGTVTVGITPQRKLSERFSLFLDASYIINPKQHYSYSGILMSDDYASQVGGFASFSIGLMVYLGSESSHADWY